jgi:SAM-dependent methyltransferase
MNKRYAGAAHLTALRNRFTCAFWELAGAWRNLYCPLCRNGFDRMDPFTGSYYVRGVLVDHYTENAVCPSCGAKIRHRLMAQLLIHRTDILSSRKRVLHFAPEVQVAAFLKSLRNIAYTACDSDTARYPGVLRIDLPEIPLPDAGYDAIICSHVLEHIGDDTRALTEMFRVLTPGGWAVIAIPLYGDTTFEVNPLDFTGREKMYGVGSHQRMNGLDFTRKLEGAGFAVTVHSFDTIPGNYVDRSVRSPHMESDKYLFYCTKGAPQ